MSRSAALIGSILLAVSACASGTSEPGPEPSVDGVVLHGSGAVLESPEHGPMIAWSFLFSNPPQGGVLALSNWDWDQVDGEESSGGTTRGGPYDFVGVWDGSEFTLTERAVAVPAGADRFQPGGTDCTDPALSETIELLRAFDRNALGLGSRGSRMIASECTAFVEAYFDTPELRAALASIADDVHVDFYFRPVDDAPPAASPATEASLEGLTFLALPAEGIDATVSIAFAGDRLTYRSTCNSLFGSFSIDDGILEFGTGGSTLIGCDEPDSMGVVGELLASRPSVQLDSAGALTIVGKNRTLVVHNEATAEPTSPIMGTWRVASILLGQGAESMWTLTSAAITIEPNRIVIHGPCTDGAATASLDARRLTVTAIDYSPGICDEQGTELEAALLTVFSTSSVDSVAFDIVTTRSGIRLEPVVTPEPHDFQPVGLVLVSSE